ncbi:cytochrome P450 [Aspergillus ellipticus CBS 707.79]|uniref:Cytochrome P450 n=1 Tax=Aspergillus ellipticus CBS 707.79 TaxID=1448320 RepID=A0A319DI75_9EURO|nr:cytochrome P450 [Aspergillus ellipticus CBS 707.79]
MSLQTIPTQLPTIAGGILCAWLLGHLGHLGQAVWNLAFHPLSRIPGPKLAGATYLPEFYYDVVLGGQYTNRIQKMHADYGPLVRISPNEVHCSDPRFINEIYAVGGRRRDKPVHQVRGSGTRTALARFFSRAQVARLEPRIEQLVQRLCDKLLAQRGKGPFNLTTAYSCFSSDVISDYCFGQGFGFLAQPSWEPNFRAPLYALLKPMFLFRFFPFLAGLSVAASGITQHVSPDMKLLIHTLTVAMPSQIQTIKSDHAAGISSAEQTAFGSLLDSSLPVEEKSVSRLTDEATALLAAGTETISWALTVIAFHLLTKPAVRAQLDKEVRGATDTNALTWASLEKLPCLGAVIQEGLRLSYGVSGRTARIAPDETLVYRGPAGQSYLIPPGFAVGMSSAIIHHDERAFPDSHAFVPERWLDAQMQRNLELHRYMLSFSKGSRACIGMNLAFCELYLVLAALLVRVLPHMHLFETSEWDVRYDHDMFNPMPRAESLGVRVVIN